MPNGCEGIYWANVAELRKTNPAWLRKILGPGFGVRTEDIDRITIGSPVWPSPNDTDWDFQFCNNSHAVAMIGVAQRVTALEAKGQIEKSLGTFPWREETIRGVTLHVQQSKTPIAFFQPAKQTLVIGSAKLVREVLVRGAGLQLSGKLAAAWARLDQSHAIGLMMGPPAAGEPVRAFLPDDLRRDRAHTARSRHGCGQGHPLSRDRSLCGSWHRIPGPRSMRDLLQSRRRRESEVVRCCKIFSALGERSMLLHAGHSAGEHLPGRLQVDDTVGRL